MKLSALNVHALAGVHEHCVTQARQRIPFFRDLTDAHIKNLVEQAVRCSAALELVFENPRDPLQRLAYAQFHGRDVWIVLGPNATHRPGDWLAVTVLVSKSPHRDMLAHVRERLGLNNGDVEVIDVAPHCHAQPQEAP